MSGRKKKARVRVRHGDEGYGVLKDSETFRIERLLPGPIERVWSYLTDPEKRRKWFGGGPMDLRAGGGVELQFRFSELSSETTPADQADACEVAGLVTKCEPPRLLSYTWGTEADASEVSFELEARGERVLLVITHRGLRNRGMVLKVASGWHTHLELLCDHLNDREPRPFWTTKTRLESEYRERLGVMNSNHIETPARR
jgi:uncharacterized protein YndB with AHSA1/START domain